MKAVLTVSNNCIADTLKLVNRWAEGHPKKPKVELIGFGEKLRDADVLLLPASSMLYSAREKLAKMKSVVIVFDAPLQCTMIQPATHLDIEYQRPSYKCAFRKLTQGLVSEELDKAFGAKSVDIEWERIEVAPRLMNQQLTSILNPIMTFLHSVRDPDNRQHYQKLVYTWLFSDAPVSALQSKIMEDGNYKKVPAALAKLVEAMTPMDKAREAFREVLSRTEAGKAVSYKKLSAKYGVAVFDLRYTMSVVRKLGKYHVVQKTVKELYDTRQKEKRLKE